MRKSQVPLMCYNQEEPDYGDPPFGAYFVGYQFCTTPSNTSYGATGWNALDTPASLTDMYGTETLGLLDPTNATLRAKYGDKDGSSQVGLELLVGIDYDAGAKIVSDFGLSLDVYSSPWNKYSLDEEFVKAYIWAAADGIGGLRWWELDLVSQMQVWLDDNTNDAVIISQLGAYSVYNTADTDLWDEVKAAHDYRNGKSWATYPMGVQMEFG